MRHTYGRYRPERILVPVPAFLTCATIGAVVGLGVIGWWAAAGFVVTSYVIFGGRAGGRAPTWHVFAWAWVMMFGLALWTLALGLGLVALVFALVAVACAVGCYTVRRADRRRAAQYR